MPLADSYLFENTHFKFKPNFSGKEGPYNRAGDMNFTIPLDDDIAQQMLRDGWNVKTYRPKDSDEPLSYYIQVAVSFKNRPPRIVFVTQRGRTTISEDMCAMVDWVDVKYIDVTIRPYAWAVQQNSGVKAYLKTIYIVIDEDALDLKYAHLPELDASGQLAIGGSDPNTIDYDGPVYENETRELGR